MDLDVANNPLLIEALTGRERNVIQLHLAGLDNDEISDHVGIDSDVVASIIKSVPGNLFMSQLREVRSARPDRIQEIMSSAIEDGMNRMAEMMRNPSTPPKELLKLMEFFSERCSELGLQKIDRKQVNKVSAVLHNQNIKAANDRVHTARRALMDGIVDVTPDDANANNPA